MIVRLEIGKHQWRPGETLEGTVSWELTGTPGAVEVRLSWETQGKGTQDTKIVQRVRFDNPALSDRKPFRIELPEGPYSFSGKLVSLVWSVEAVGESGGKSGRVKLTISPTGSEILLHRK